MLNHHNNKQVQNQLGLFICSQRPMYSCAPCHPMHSDQVQHLPGLLLVATIKYTAVHLATLWVVTRCSTYWDSWGPQRWRSRRRRKGWRTKRALAWLGASGSPSHMPQGTAACAPSSEDQSGQRKNCIGASQRTPKWANYTRQFQRWCIIMWNDFMQLWVHECKVNRV